MALACLIASVGILLDSPILIVGAMIVGPEFGPIAGLCVALVQRRRDVARRSLRALAVGFPVGITAACLFALAIRAVDLTPEAFIDSDHPLTDFISHPDAFSSIVAVCRRGRRDALADLGQVRRPDRGAGLGDDDPGGRQHRRRRRLRDWSEWRGAMLQLARQPGRDRARRGRDPVRPAPALRAPPPRPPATTAPARRPACRSAAAAGVGSATYKAPPARNEPGDEMNRTLTDLAVILGAFAGATALAAAARRRQLRHRAHLRRARLRRSPCSG